MTRVNTLKDIEALYEESVLVDSNELITENEKVGKHTADSELENEKKVSKTRAKCQAKAKRKYDVWPSAYASGYVQKCVNRGGNIK